MFARQAKSGVKTSRKWIVVLVVVVLVIAGISWYRLRWILTASSGIVRRAAVDSSHPSAALVCW